MQLHHRRWLVAGLVVGMGIVAGSGPSTAADADKELQEAVRKIGSAIEKKDAAEAKKQAAALAKKTDTDMESVMHLFSPRLKGGLGVGPKADEVKPDGIEKKLQEMVKKPLAQDQLEGEAAALQQMGVDMAAICEVVTVLVPDKGDAAKKKKEWVAMTAELREAGLQLAAAAKDKKADPLHQAVRKAHASCEKCHEVFR